MTYLNHPFRAQAPWRRYRFPGNRVFTLLTWHEAAASWLLDTTFQLLDGSLRVSHKVLSFIAGMPPAFSGIDRTTNEFVCGWCGTRTRECEVLELSCCKHEAYRLFLL